MPYWGGIEPLTLSSCFCTLATCVSNLASAARIASRVLGSGALPSSPPPHWITSAAHTAHLNAIVAGSIRRAASRLLYRLPQISGSFAHLNSTETGPFSAK